MKIRRRALCALFPGGFAAAPVGTAGCGDGAVEFTPMRTALAMPERISSQVERGR